MKCTDCGEYKESNNIITNHGNAFIEKNIITDTTVNKLCSALKDGLFLTVCILISVSALFSFFSGKLSVINVLFTVFLWIAYAHSHKNQLNSYHMRLISGTVYTIYIINYVLAILLIFIGIIGSLILKSLIKSNEFIKKLVEITNFYDYVPENLTPMISVLISIASFAILLAAAGVILVNFFGFRKIHEFTKSIYTGLNDNKINFSSVAAAQSWLFVIGGLYIFLAFTSHNTIGAENIHTIMARICEGFAAIFSGALVNKYFCIKL